MTFLPIVDRELRVAARKTSTFWSRVGGAGAAVAIASGFLFLHYSLPTFTPGTGAPNFGKIMFLILSWLGLAAALTTGLFFTSDCLSEEKREGTLGLLFLTDLRGYDVVLGKLLSTSLRGVFALLAIFPVLAIGFLMGGVTGAAFWKTNLALLNALIFSLAVGMSISAISRHSQKAMTATFFVMLLFTIGAPIADVTVVNRGLRPFFNLANPAYSLLLTDRWGAPFWNVLIVNQAIAWLLLGFTCIVLPRAWQEKSNRSLSTGTGRFYNWKFGAPASRARLRRKLLELNPVTWLACRERWQTIGIWIMSLFLLVVMIATLFSGISLELWALWSYVGGAISLVFYLFTTSQACRFFVEARRSGLIELLLASPLNEGKIIHGHWRGLLRLLGPPLLIFLGLQLVAAGLSHQAWSSAMSGSAKTFATSPWLSAVSAFTNGLMLVLNLTALCWVGMWMGLTSRSANIATLKTLLFVQIIPWFIISFLSTIVTGTVLMSGMITSSGNNPGDFMAWYPLVTIAIKAILACTKDILFWQWARRRLHQNLRTVAAQIAAPIHITKPPPLPGPAATPPVLPATS